MDNRIKSGNKAALAYCLTQCNAETPNDCKIYKNMNRCPIWCNSNTGA